MLHASAIAESIIAPALFRPEFSHSLDPKETLTLLLSATGDHLGMPPVAYPEVEPSEILACRPVLHVQRARMVRRYYDPLGRKTHRDRGADADFALQVERTAVQFDEGLG